MLTLQSPWPARKDAVQAIDLRLPSVLLFKAIQVYESKGLVEKTGMPMDLDGAAIGELPVSPIRRGGDGDVSYQSVAFLVRTPYHRWLASIASIGERHGDMAILIRCHLLLMLVVMLIGMLSLLLLECLLFVVLLWPLMRRDYWWHETGLKYAPQCPEDGGAAKGQAGQLPIAVHRDCTAALV